MDGAKNMSTSYEWGGIGLGLLDAYTYLMVDLRDPRVDSWPLMYSIWPTVSICAAYVYFVKILGPKLMKDREPYDIRGIMVVYNLFQTIFSGWMFKESCLFFLTGKYNWHCEPVDYSNSQDARRVLSLGWWYFFSKFIDLVDTVFFIARKKYSHISALHVIHHSTLPILSWWGPRFVGGGQTGFAPFLNSGVHTVMYGYYFLAAMGPQVQKFLWWKKYITTIQLIQFVMVFFHALQPIFFTCDYPKAASIMFACTGLQYFILFTAFYKKTYRKPPTPALKKVESSEEDLLEELGDTVDRVRRDSLNIVERVRRKSLTTLGKLGKNSLNSQTLLSQAKIKELEGLSMAAVPRDKEDKED